MFLTTVVRRPLVAASALMSAILTIAAGATLAEAKTPGSTYCFNGICHRVKSIAETQGMVGRHESLVTSYYDDCSRDPYNPCGLTSSGERFRPDRADNAASPIYPDGTTLIVRNPATGASAVVRVNNAGPYHSNRKLDLSRAAADKLGFRKRGIAKLEVSVLSAPTKQEARYVKERRYRDVPGFIGQHASLDAARTGTAARIALAASGGSVLAPAAAGMMAAARAEFALPAKPGKAAKVAAEKPKKPAKGAKTSMIDAPVRTAQKPLRTAALAR